MKAIALLVAVPALVAQTLNPSPQELLNLARPLTTTEIATLLNAARQALSGRTFRLLYLSGSQGPVVLMGPVGRPKIIRTAYGVESAVVSGLVSGAPDAGPRVTGTRWHEDVINIADYTGRPARRCDDITEQGELVIEYVHHSTTNAWTVTARGRSADDVGGPGIAPLFQMLLGAVPPAIGDRRQIGDRWARAFVASWTPPPVQRVRPPLLTGDPLPNVAGEPARNEAMQSLWIDTESLLPLRLEVSKGDRLVNGFDITYESIDLRPPEGVDAPECIR